METFCVVCQYATLQPQQAALYAPALYKAIRPVKWQLSATGCLTQSFISLCRCYIYKDEYYRHDGKQAKPPS